MDGYIILIITILSLLYTSLFMGSVLFSFLKKKWNNSVKGRKKGCKKFHRSIKVGNANYCLKRKSCYF